MQSAGDSEELSEQVFWGFFLSQKSGKGEEGWKEGLSHTMWLPGAAQVFHANRWVHIRRVHLPFATLGVRVVREEHGQELHEVSPLRPLFALGSQRPATDAARVGH